MGWGQVGQHRKHGQKGGRKSGRHKHLWTTVLRYDPNYFGKTRFKTPQSITGQSHPTTINITQLDQLIEKQTRNKQITKKHGKPYIDLTNLGYQKLLAKGTPTHPAIIKINTYSKNAAKKIQDAGGQITSPTIGKPKQPEQSETPETTEAQPTQPEEPTPTEDQTETEQP